MRLVNISLLLALPLLEALSGCSSPPDRPAMGTKSGASSEATGTDTIPTGPAAPNPSPNPQSPAISPTGNLQLGALSAGADWKGAFDLSKPLELLWLSDSDVLMANDSGKSVVYNVTGETWSSVHQNPEAGSFPQFFDFRDGGYVAFTDQAISFRASAGGITNVKQVDSFKGMSASTVNPNSVMYKVGAGLKVVRTTNGAASLVTPVGVPANIEALYPCNAGCEFYGFDGSKIHLYIGEGKWSVDARTFNLPAGESVLRMAVRFKGSAGSAAAAQVFAQSSKGNLFILADAGSANSNVEWTEVLALSKRFCVACHIDDGYDKEDTWKELKDQILVAMKAKQGDKNAMPPFETALGKEMSEAEKARIISWMEKQEKKARGSIGGDGDEGKTDRNASIAGDLKKFGEPNCVSCHSTAGKMGFWLDMKADAISRIRSGNMPKGKTMSAGDRDALIKAIEAVK